MEILYIEELRSSINQLMLNLESLPVSKGGADGKYGLQKLKRYNHSNSCCAFKLILSIHHNCINIQFFFFLLPKTVDQ
ncbi:hypothetical protein NPIL_181991, partial [Nephila pilipes]